MDHHTPKCDIFATYEQPEGLRGTPFKSWEAYNLAVRDRLSSLAAAELAAVAVSRGYKARHD